MKFMTLKPVILSLFPAILAAGISVLFIAPAFAEDRGTDEKMRISAGLTVYYAWWDPVWKTIDNTAAAVQFLPLGVRVSPEMTYPMDEGAVLFGPSVSLRIDGRWSVAFNFLFGKYTTSADYPVLVAPYLVPLNMDLDAYKYDADVLVGFAINEQVKIFFGPKLQGYSYKISSESLFAALAPKIDYTLISAGAGGGVGLTLRVYENLYFLPVLSVFTLVGGGVGSSQVGSQTSFALGANAIASLAYYIEQLNTTVSLGFRMQYIYYARKPIEGYGDSGDLFYGIHLSAVYSF